MARYWVPDQDPAWHDEAGQFDGDMRTLGEIGRALWNGIREAARQVRAGRKGQQ